MFAPEVEEKDRAEFLNKDGAKNFLSHKLKNSKLKIKMGLLERNEVFIKNNYKDLYCDTCEYKNLKNTTATENVEQ